MDMIRLDVPLFIRLLELAREDIKNDQDLHDIAEIVTQLSQHSPVTMEDYPAILKFMQNIDKPEAADQEMNDIKKLSGL